MSNDLFSQFIVSLPPLSVQFDVAIGLVPLQNWSVLGRLNLGDCTALLKVFVATSITSCVGTLLCFDLGNRTLGIAFQGHVLVSCTFPTTECH